MKQKKNDNAGNHMDAVQNGVVHHLTVGDYVLTCIPNAFNGKNSWWLSKRNKTCAMYCFSTSGSEQSQKKEAEYHIKHIDAYVAAFEARFMT